MSGLFYIFLSSRPIAFNRGTIKKISLKKKNSSKSSLQELESIASAPHLQLWANASRDDVESTPGHACFFFESSKFGTQKMRRFAKLAKRPKIIHEQKTNDYQIRDFRRDQICAAIFNVYTSSDTAVSLIV